jgi:hypothetical protein
MQTTIKQLVQERLHVRGLSATPQDISKAYARNYKHRRAGGQYCRAAVADEITHYLTLNNIAT